MALITFDQNVAIATDQVDEHDPSKGTDPIKQALVTIDDGAPTSTVAALPATGTLSKFTVTWSGQDDAGGSGIATYDVYVSDNGGPFALFQSRTAATSATFIGRNGHTYGFYSAATDNVGNVQPASSAAQATTTMSFPVYDTTTTLRTNKNPTKVGMPVTFTATVAAPTGAPVPSGTVQFLIDGSPAGAPVALLNGVATSGALTTLTGGTHAIGANFVGADFSFNPSTATLAGGEIVAKAATTTLAGPATFTPVRGQALTIYATVGPAAGAGPPTGTVTFRAGSTVLGTESLTTSNGSTYAALPLSSVAMGAYTITASYEGDGSYLPSSATTSFVVGKDATTTVAAPTVTSPVIGQAVTFFAVVSVNAPGTGAATGLVGFVDGTTVLGYAPVVANPQGVTYAQFTTSPLAVGAHKITAVYEGDAADDFSVGSFGLTVAKRSTTTTAVPSTTAPAPGQAVTFFAVVSVDTPGTGSPTGYVGFLDGSAVLSYAPLVTNAQGVTYAQFTTSALALGGHTISAVYGGDAADISSIASFKVTVAKRSTTTTAVASPAAPAAGQNVTFFAVVAANAPAAGAPGGYIGFLDGASVLAYIPLVTNPQGVTYAQFTTSSLAVGTHTITAVYGGDAADNPSLASFKVAVTGATPHALRSFTAMTPSNSSPILNPSMASIASTPTDTQKTLEWAANLAKPASTSSLQISSSARNALLLSGKTSLSSGERDRIWLAALKALEADRSF